jgi:hypothetical protein
MHADVRFPILPGILALHSASQWPWLYHVSERPDGVRWDGMSSGTIQAQPIGEDGGFLAAFMDGVRCFGLRGQCIRRTPPYDPHSLQLTLDTDDCWAIRAKYAFLSYIS